MPLRENLVSAAIGSASGVLAALLVVGVHDHVSGVGAGDVLQFFGAIVGTGLAITGAAWIEANKRRIDAMAAARPVLDALLRLERRSRPFFSISEERRDSVDRLRSEMDLLKRTLSLAPPRTAQLIGLFDRLEDGADFLTSELFLLMNDQALHTSSPARHRVESLLERFDGPLKVLVVEYSRMVDPKAVRSVPHIGAMPEL